VDKPMLAGTLDNLGTLRFPVLASPKLDGIRAIVDLNGNLMSRNGKLIQNEHVRRLFSLKALAGLDGELICGDPTGPTVWNSVEIPEGTTQIADSVFRRTSSAVMSRDGEPNVVFHVFDRQNGVRYAFADRLREIKEVLHEVSYPVGYVKLVPHLTIKTEEELLRYEEVCLSKGFEGVMVRDPAGPYKHGRSTVKEGWLLKLKRFQDSEAIVIGAFELNHNFNEKDASGKRTSHAAGKVAAGILGGFVARDVKSGVEFEIGTGFTREQRQDWFLNAISGKLNGKVLTYKFFPSGSKNKPRFPVFRGWRDDL
jgi:DNA ligase-1